MQVARVLIIASLLLSLPHANATEFKKAGIAGETGGRGVRGTDPAAKGETGGRGYDSRTGITYGSPARTAFEGDIYFADPASADQFLRSLPSEGLVIDQRSLDKIVRIEATALASARNELLPGERLDLPRPHEDFNRWVVRLAARWRQSLPIVAGTLEAVRASLQEVGSESRFYRQVGDVSPGSCGRACVRTPIAASEFFTGLHPHHALNLDQRLFLGEAPLLGAQNQAMLLFSSGLVNLAATNEVVMGERTLHRLVGLLTATSPAQPVSQLISRVNERGFLHTQVGDRTTRRLLTIRDTFAYQELVRRVQHGVSHRIASGIPGLTERAKRAIEHELQCVTLAHDGLLPRAVQTVLESPGYQVAY